MKEPIKNEEKSGKEKLRKLEAKGRCLFHGSGMRLKTLEPRQAYTYPENNTTTRIPDGEPAVFASDVADAAIFMAVVSKPNVPKTLRSGYVNLKNKGFKFMVTQETMDQIKNAKGFVHVFNRNEFEQKGDTNVWTCQKIVKPIEIIEVSERDLPSVEIKDF